MKERSVGWGIYCFSNNQHHIMMWMRAGEATLFIYYETARWIRIHLVFHSK